MSNDNQNFNNAFKDPLFESGTSKSRASRTILTTEQAVQIYHLKFDTAQQFQSQGARATAVGHEFGVSEKAVRDIWSGRTWQSATKHVARQHSPDEKKHGHLNGQVGDTKGIKQFAGSIAVSSIGPLNTDRTQSSTVPTIRNIDAVPHSRSETCCEESVANPFTRPRPDSVLQAQRVSYTSTSCALSSPIPSSPFSMQPHPSVSSPTTAVAEPTRLAAASVDDQTPQPLHWRSERSATGSAEVADALPPQSRADDPFHDDWPHWGRS
jgi:hypothetical protein